MGPINPEDEALKRILGDMDGMESGRMFGGSDNKGVSITISVVPNSDEGSSEEMPEGIDQAMSAGGMVERSPVVEGKSPEDGVVDGAVDDPKGLPPFLRKKKKSIQDA